MRESSNSRSFCPTDIGMLGRLHVSREKKENLNRHWSPRGISNAITHCPLHLTTAPTLMCGLGPSNCDSWEDSDGHMKWLDRCVSLYLPKALPA